MLSNGTCNKNGTGDYGMPKWHCFRTQQILCYKQQHRQIQFLNQNRKFGQRQTDANFRVRAAKKRHNITASIEIHRAATPFNFPITGADEI